MGAVIWKHPVDLGKPGPIRLPKGAQLLRFALDPQGVPSLWESHDEDSAETERRGFFLVGTGHPFDTTDATYIGTVNVGPLVLHLFEVRPW